MEIKQKGLKQINGSLVVLEGVENPQYEEMVEIELNDSTKKIGRIVKIDGDKVVVQVFEGTRGISMTNVKTRKTGKPMDSLTARKRPGHWRKRCCLRERRFIPMPSWQIGESAKKRNYPKSPLRCGPWWPSAGTVPCCV